MGNLYATWVKLPFAHDKWVKLPFAHDNMCQKQQHNSRALAPTVSIELCVRCRFCQAFYGLKMLGHAQRVLVFASSTVGG